MSIIHTKRPCSRCGKPHSNSKVHKETQCWGKPESVCDFCSASGPTETCINCGKEFCPLHGSLGLCNRCFDESNDRQTRNNS